MQEFFEFYSKLYAPPASLSATQADSFFNDIPFPLVAHDHIELMETEFTEAEVAADNKSLNPKAPGPDGLESTLRSYNLIYVPS